MGFYLGRFGEEFLDGRCSVSVVRGFAFTVALVTNFPLIELRRTILVPPLAIGFPPWVKLSNSASAIRKCGSANVATTHSGCTQAGMSFVQNASEKSPGMTDYWRVPKCE
jgi:hypothetical protein